jgi:uncharacterized membrane protein YjgN (DUF898 family)
MSWFYAEGGTQKGPVTDETFRALVEAGTITSTTLVWRAGMADWQPYSAIASGPPASAASVTAGSAVAGGSAATAGAGSTPASAAAPSGPSPLTFSGDADEYFKIWIVNLLLTIATLGIYAAWAKVRTRRYFYANTRLLGHAFEYLADPKRILIGNIIVVVLFFGLNFAQTISVVLAFVLFGVVLLATPWLVIRALLFNARNSAWRGLRFHFNGGYGEAFKVFVLFPLITALSLGFAFPWVAKRQREWVVNRHAYGQAGFNFSGLTKEFYRIYFTALAFILPFVACMLVVVAMAPRLEAGAVESEPPLVLLPVFFLMMPAYLLAYGGFFYLRVNLFNYSWNNTQIAGNRFRATMRFWDFLGLQLVNMIVTGLTMGLMYPWARVRLARYTASSLQVIPAGNLDAFVASAQPNVSAIGEAGSDILDLDIGIDFGL